MPVLGIIAAQNYPRTITVDYLVVAGGGAGGSGGFSGGGGGAGGLRCTVTASGGTPGTIETALTLSPSTNYTVNWRRRRCKCFPRFKWD